MADLKIMYELKQSNNHGAVQQIMFDFCVADLNADFQAASPLVLKSKTAYEVTTLSKTIKVKVVAQSNSALYRWDLTIWLVDGQGNKTKDLTPVPISKSVDGSENANYNQTVKWKD